MKNVVQFITGLLAVVGIFLLAFTSMSFLENSRNEFSNYEAMEAAGMIGGWLPVYFPKSATRILEGHNIDSNRVWARFQYEKSDVQSIAEVCQKIAGSERGIKFLCPPYDSHTSTMIFRHNMEGYYLSYENAISYPIRYANRSLDGEK